LGAPFLLKMFVEALPLVPENATLRIIDIYDKFEEHCFDRELKKQETYVNEIKYTVKKTSEYK